MKVMTLNLWCGCQFESLKEFIESMHETIDVFCFQEVFDFNTPEEPIQLGDKIGGVYNLFEMLQELLPQFHAYFVPCLDRYGNAMFVRNTYDVRDTGNTLLYKGSSKHFYIPGQTRYAQYVDLSKNNKTWKIINVHGIWTGGPKTDTIERIEQSRIIRALMDESEYPVVLCGDLNVLARYPKS